ncbi:MAG TPA: hypothetical protein VGI39_31235 [Polyangiaceae bacterium]
MSPAPYRQMSSPPEAPRPSHWLGTALLVLLSAAAWGAFCVPWARLVGSPAEITLADPRTPPEVAPPEPRGDEPALRDPEFHFIPTPPTNFDREAAAKALAQVSVEGCRQAGDPQGEAHVKVTFAPDGHVISSVVDQPPFARTATGRCVAERFQALRLPSFGGAAVSIGKSVEIGTSYPTCTCKSGDPLCSCIQ